MRDFSEPVQPLGKPVERPKPKGPDEWQPTDTPGILRNIVDGRLKNDAPTPPKAV